MTFSFEKSLFKFADYKPTLFPEVAFAGRSNVGKSSLINSLFGGKKAHVSKTPGKTQSINFYSAGGKLVVADLPGYGFAKVSDEIKERWGELIEGYISGSPKLDIVYLLIDSRRGPGKDERVMLEWLTHINRKCVVVFTKVDKLTTSELCALKKRYADTGAIFFSSKSGAGKKELSSLLGI